MAETIFVNCETLTPIPPAPVRRASKPIPVHISGTTVPDCFCGLEGIAAGTLYVRSDRQIPEASAVVVSFDHVQLSGVIAACTPADNGWMISVALASCRRRLDERIADGQETIIGIVGTEGTSLHQCTIIDTSSFGLGLRLSFPIPTGARVCVETDAAMVFGEIRYCQQKSDGQFVAGVLVVDVAPDVRTQNQFSVMLNNLRWKLASSIRGRDVPAYRADH
jgi:hypothetical protein